MAAYTFIFAINQGKNPDEGMEISDKIFVGIMRGNKIKPAIMFTEERNIKPNIINKVTEKTSFCKKATQKAVAKLFKARGLEEPSLEIKKRLSDSFGYWWISTIENIYKQSQE